MEPPQIVDQLSEALGRRVTLREGGARAVAGTDVPFGGGRGAVRIHGRVRGELTAGEWALVDAAVHLLDLAAGEGPGGVRDRLFARLLDAESSVRRDALWELRSRRWVDDRGRGVDLLAVVLDDGPELRTVAFGRHLAGVLAGAVHFVGVRSGAAIFVASPDLDVDGLTRAVDAEAVASGRIVRGVALAAGSPRDVDVDDAVSRAIRSALLRATLPGQVATLRAEDLGGWALVEALPRSRSLLLQACPAAVVLASGDDPTPRETVEAYLDAAGRAPVACQRLHIHRTTLYYRLEQMPEVVREALADGLQRSTLHLALKLLRLWEGELQGGDPALPAAAHRGRRDERLRA